jgi:hypothetical protein
MRSKTFDYFDLPAGTEVWLGSAGFKIGFPYWGRRLFVASDGKITVQGHFPITVKREDVVNLVIRCRDERGHHVSIFSWDRDRTIEVMTDYMSKV